MPNPCWSSTLGVGLRRRPGERTSRMNFLTARQDTRRLRLSVEKPPEPKARRLKTMTLNSLSAGVPRYELYAHRNPMFHRRSPLGRDCPAVIQSGCWGSAEQPCASRAAARGRGRRPQETGGKTQRALSDEQERVRVEALRIVARMIARHALAHPGLSEGGRRGEGPEPPVGDEGATGGPPERTDDAA